MTNEFQVLLQAVIDSTSVQEQLDRIEELSVAIKHANLEQSAIDEIKSKLSQNGIDLNLVFNSSNTEQIKTQAEKVGTDVGTTITKAVNNSTQNLFSNLNDLKLNDTLLNSLNQIDTSNLTNAEAILSQVKEEFANLGEVRITDQIYNAEGELEQFRVKIQQTNGDLKEARNFILEIGENGFSFPEDSVIKGTETFVHHLTSAKGLTGKMLSEEEKIALQVDDINRKLDNGLGSNAYQNTIDKYTQDFEKYGLSAEEAQEKTSKLRSILEEMQSESVSGKELIDWASQFNTEVQNVKVSVDDAKNSYNEFQMSSTDKIRNQAQADAKELQKVAEQVDAINLKMNNGQGDSVYQNTIDKLVQDFEKYGLSVEEAESKTSELRNILTAMQSSSSNKELINWASSFDKEVSKVKVSLDSAKNSYNSFQKSSGNDKLKSQAEADAREFEKVAQQLDAINAKINNGEGYSSYQNQIDKLVQGFEKYGLSAEEAASKTQNLQNIFNQMAQGTASSSQMIQWAKDFDIELANVKTSLDNAKLSYDKFSQPVSNEKISTLVNRINMFLQQNTKITASARTELEGYVTTLKSGDTISLGQWNQFNTALNDIKTNMSALNKLGQSFTTIFKQAATSLSTWVSAGAVVASLVSKIRQIPSIVTDLDTALVDLKKTTTMTNEELEEFYYEANDIAKALGTTTEEVIQSAAEWSRLGYSSKEAAEQMAAYTAQFAAISPGMSVDSATEYLVSIMKAYGFEVDDVLDGIMSKINAVGNSFAESNEDIAMGLENASSTWAALGESFEDTVAVFTAAEEIVQDASKVGNGLRTIALRIRGYNEETEELDDELTNISGKLIDLTKVASNDFQGISIFTDETKSEYKSLAVYLQEIADIYDELEPEAQTNLLQTLFGKTRASIGAAIIQNIDAVDASLEVMENSVGAADAEMEIITESVEYSANRASEAFTGLSQTILSSDAIKAFYDFIASLVEGIDNVIESVGSLNLAFGALGTVLVTKGLGLD